VAAAAATDEFAGEGQVRAFGVRLLQAAVSTRRREFPDSLSENKFFARTLSEELTQYGPYLVVRDSYILFFRISDFQSL
jgi:hypothetical protein